MELYQLKAFITVAEEGNVTRAAERLFASQPAVSAQIKALEQEFGLTLFRRTPGGMVPTEPGLKLLTHAKSVLQQSRGMEDLVRHLRDGSAGTLRVGLNDVDASRLRMHDMTAALLKHYPDLLLQFENGTSGSVYKGVKAHDLDVGVVEGTFNDPRLFTMQYDQTQLCIITPTAWQTQLDNDDWHALERYPWIFTSPDCSYHRLLERLCDEHSLTLQKQFRIDHEGTALHFARTGLAVSIIDRPRAQAAAERGEVFIWPGFHGTLPLSLCALKARLDEPPIQTFFEIAQNVFELDDNPVLD